MLGDLQKNTDQWLRQLNKTGKGNMINIRRERTATTQRQARTTGAEECKTDQKYSLEFFVSKQTWSNKESVNLKTDTSKLCT